MAFVLVALTGGCRSSLGSQAVVTIPHPSRVELVAAATQIEAPDLRREGGAVGLRHDQLLDRAALTRVDADAVCVQLALWSLPDDPARSDLDSYDLALEAHDEDRLEVLRPSSRAPVGRWQRRVQAERSVRGPAVAYRQAAPIEVEYAAEDLCFEGRGLPIERLRALTLLVRRGQRPVRYTWQLDPHGRYPDEAVQSAGAVVIRPAPDEAASRGAIGAAGIRAMGRQVEPEQPGAAAGGLTSLPYPTERVPGGHPPDEGRLRRLLDARFGDLRRCLSRAAEEAPELLGRRGQVVAEFTVGPSGVGNVRIVDNDFGEPVAACMRRHLNELPVPADPRRWTALYRYGVANRRPTDGPTDDPTDDPSDPSEER